jgi:hypothetical protein
MRVHPGLRPEVEAFQALVDGSYRLVDLERAYNKGGWPDRPLTAVEKRMASILASLPSTAPHNTLASVLDVLIMGHYDELLNDNPAGKETAAAVKGMLLAKSRIFDLRAWQNAA